MSHPETAVCTICGETAYLEDDGRYVCPECGNDFDDDEIEDDDDFEDEDLDYYSLRNTNHDR